MKGERDFFISTPILFKSPFQNFVFYWEGGIVCAERDVTQQGSREET